MKTLRDIEIFYPGVWNGDEYTEADVIEMVNTANECAPYIQPQLSLNHQDVAPDIIRQASFGAIMHFTLRTINGVKRIFCDIAHVRDDLADLILYHYPRRSIDLWPTWTHPEKKRTFRNVITGVSFLGAKMPPAVEGMLPEFAVAFQQPAHRAGAVTITIGVTHMSKTTFQHAPGASIAARRAELGLTTADVLSRVNANEAQPVIAEQTLLDVEAGIVTPGAALLDRLALALETDVAALSDRQTFQAEGEPLGAYLRAVREEKELTPEEVALACEITPEQLTAYEEGEFVTDADLAKIANVLQLDLDDLRTRRGAAPEAEPTAEMAAAGEPDKAPDAQLAFRKQLDAVEQEKRQFQQERDAERAKRETLERDHFFDRLETKYQAAKILTGEPVRAFAAALDTRQTIQFSQGSPPQTMQTAFLKFLEQLAQGGAYRVPVEQHTQPVASKKTFANTAEEARSLIHEYQQTNHCEYIEARLAVKTARPELFA